MYIRCLETRTRTLCTIFKLEFSTEYWKSCCKLKRNSNDLEEEQREGWPSKGTVGICPVPAAAKTAEVHDRNANANAKNRNKSRGGQIKMYEMLSQNTGKYLPRSFSLCVGVAHVACLHVRVCVGVCVCALEKHLTLPCPSKKTKLCEINVRGYGVNVAFIQNGYRATGAGAVAQAEAGEALAQRTKASNVIKNKLNGKCKRKRRTQQSDLQTDRQTDR